MKENINLATTTNITSTYAGEFAQEYIAAALLSANSLEKGAFTIIPNVKNTYTISKGATGSLLKNATCDFDATGSITLTEKVLTVKHMNVNLQVCTQDYRDQWDAASMGYSDHDVLPKNFSDFILAHVIADVAASLETLIWSGTSTTAGEIGGVETEIALDAALPAAQEVGGAAVAVSTIIVELRKITAAIPNSLYGNPDLRIYCSPAIFKAYIGALGGNIATTGTHAGVDGKGTMWYTNGMVNFDGIPLFMCNGMTSTVAICTTKQNLLYVNTVASDLSDVRVIDMSPIDGSDNVRIVMKMGAVASYKFAEDVVTYGITNSAN